MLTALKGEYGLGLMVGETAGHKWFSHGGSNAGYQCIMFAYNDGGGAIVMTNGDRGGALAEEILGNIAIEYGWTDHLPKPR